ncbi:MAG: hypothetical protein M3P82_02095 [Bacteroidota bacterium]|nr:hypothetical protein [Bacteroidota bacterium]
MSWKHYFKPIRLVILSLISARSCGLVPKTMMMICDPEYRPRSRVAASDFF